MRPGLMESGRRVFVLMSDGECDEGSNWEAVLFGAHHELSHLIAREVDGHDHGALFECLSSITAEEDLERVVEVIKKSRD